MFTSLSVDELLSVLDKDTLCILAYTLALQVVNGSVLVKLLLNGNVVNAGCYTVERIDIVTMVELMRTIIFCQLSVMITSSPTLTSLTNSSVNFSPSK